MILIIIGLFVYLIIKQYHKIEALDMTVVGKLDAIGSTYQFLQDTFDKVDDNTINVKKKLNATGGIAVTGNTSVSGTSTVTGNQTVGGSSTVTGTSSVTGDISGGGNITIPAGKGLKIGGTLLTEDHIKMLNGGADVFINANGPTTGGVLRVDGTYDSGRNVYFSTARKNDAYGELFFRKMGVAA